MKYEEIDFEHTNQLFLALFAKFWALRLKDWLQWYGVSVRFAPDNFYATNIYNFCHILCVYQCIHFIPIYQYIPIFIFQQTHFDGWMLCLTSSYDQCLTSFKNNTKRGLDTVNMGSWNRWSVIFFQKAVSPKFW